MSVRWRNVEDRADTSDDADDFFVGIGDINGSFLPPTPPNPISSASPAPAQSASSSESPSSAPSSPPPETPPESSSLIAQAKLLDEVSKARPLARLQEELEKKEDVEDIVEAAKMTSNGQEAEEKKSSTPPGSPTKPRKPLLNVLDDELDRVARARPFPSQTYALIVVVRC